jgi:autotransporter-associated beta strand protein
MLVPERYQEFLTRASEYGNSRVVLGVHYPLDVMMGRILGTYDVVQMLNNNPKYLNATVNGVFGIGDLTTTGNFTPIFNNALTDTRTLLQNGCGSDLATCAATSAADRFSNHDNNRTFYTNNLTYGLAPTTLSNIPLNLFPALGTGPEVLLSTRFQYLTPAQRQDVVATTGLPAGGPLDALTADPQFAVYARLNLFAASDDYGAFNSAVTVNQDSSQCTNGISFCSFDVWRNPIGGSGSFTKTGNGTLVFTGNNTYTGGTTVNGGSLFVTGSLASQATVGSGGTLGGTGTLVNTAVNGGTLAPGLPAALGAPATPGTLTIQGNLQLNAASNYLVQFTTGSNSRTNVSGTANVANTAVTTVNFAPGIYTVNSRVPILTTAAGGLTGTFASVAFNSAGINVAPRLSYDGQDAFITLGQALVPALPAGSPGNAVNETGALNRFIANGGTLPTTFQGLYSLPPAALADTLNRMAAQTGTAAAQSASTAMGTFLGSVLDFGAPGRGDAGAAMAFAPGARISSDPRQAYAADMPRKAPILKAPPPSELPRWVTWATVFGASERLPGDVNTGAQNFSGRLFGGAAGADYRVSRDTVLGFAVAGGETHFSLANGFGSGRSDFFQGALYGQQYFGAGYVGAAVAFGTHNARTDRVVNVAGAIERLTASFDPDTIGGRIEAGYRYDFGTMGITPYAAFQVQNVSTPGYTETAGFVAGTAAQTFAARDTTWSRSEFGAWVDNRAIVSLGSVSLRGRAAWVHNFNRDASDSVAFAVLPGTDFVVNGARRPADAALLTGLVEMPIARNVTVSGKVDGEFASHATTWAGTGTLRYVW